MNEELASDPCLLGLLEAARQAPEQDTPRLVLADWLDDHGLCRRAEFIRCQLRLAPGQPDLLPAERADLEQRSRSLLSQHGGAWLGPLWQWWLSPLSWHRGLLAVGPPTGDVGKELTVVLPWIDTLLLHVSGWRRLRRGLDLATGGINHLSLDLRFPPREDALLAALAQAPDSPCLRTLSIDWPLRLLQRHEDGEEPHSSPAVSPRLLLRLLLDLPLGRHLTHLASSPGWSDEQQELIRSLGVHPATCDSRLWMHEIPASNFRARPVAS